MLHRACMHQHRKVWTVSPFALHDVAGTAAYRYVPHRLCCAIYYMQYHSGVRASICHQVWWWSLLSCSTDLMHPLETSHTPGIRLRLFREDYCHFEVVRNIPRQDNYHDCGLFVLR